jgi:hypothetical protein
MPSNFRKEESDGFLPKMRQYPDLIGTTGSIFAGAANDDRTYGYQNLSNDCRSRRLNFADLLVADIQVSKRAITRLRRNFLGAKLN